MCELLQGVLPCGCSLFLATFELSPVFPVPKGISITIVITKSFFTVTRDGKMSLTGGLKNVTAIVLARIATVLCGFDDLGTELCSKPFGDLCNCLL